MSATDKRRRVAMTPNAEASAVDNLHILLARTRKYMLDLEITNSDQNKYIEELQCDLQIAVTACKEYHNNQLTKSAEIIILKRQLIELSLENLRLAGELEKK